jgi:hypothetical protein
VEARRSGSKKVPINASVAGIGRWTGHVAARLTGIGYSVEEDMVQLCFLHLRSRRGGMSAGKIVENCQAERKGKIFNYGAHGVHGVNLLSAGDVEE